MRRAFGSLTPKTMLWRPLCSLQRTHSPIWARTSGSDTIGSFESCRPRSRAGAAEYVVAPRAERPSFEVGIGVGVALEVASADTMMGPPSPAQLRYARNSATAAPSYCHKFSTPRL